MSYDKVVQCFERIQRKLRYGGTTHCVREKYRKKTKVSHCVFGGSFGIAAGQVILKLCKEHRKKQEICHTNSVIYIPTVYRNEVHCVLVHNCVYVRTFVPHQSSTARLHDGFEQSR